MPDAILSDQNNPKKGKVKKPRSRPLPPDVAARNLAIEKQRREALNDTFLDLARLIPALAPARRISKVLIVKESIQHLRDQRSMCIAAAQDIQDLLSENRQLVSELNALRLQIGGPGMPLLQPRPATEAMVQLTGVKDQVFGTFPAGFGDNWTFESPETQPTRDSQNHVERGEVGLTTDGSFESPEQPYHTQTPPQNGSDMSYSELPNIALAENADLPQVSQPDYYEAIALPDQQPLNSQGIIPALDNQSHPLPVSYSQPMVPTAAPFGYYMPTELPGPIPTNSQQYADFDAMNPLNWSTMNPVYDNNIETLRF